MKILSVNAGSSSLKFTAFEMPEEKVLASGYFERVGIPNSFYTIKINGEKIKKEVDLPDHTTAFKILTEELMALHVVSSLDEIKGVGHRVVQGGVYADSVVIDEEVMQNIRRYTDLAPLHNPAAIKGILAAQEVIPEATHVAVFDTAFHQTMPQENYLYAVPEEWYIDYQVRRYGAHGTSHKYITQKVSEMLGRDDLKLIICHIGSGASITATKNGKSINTSMGFTPNAGLIMGTRSGDIDATILTYMMEKAHLSISEINDLLNKKSGVYALSGGYSDMRDVTEQIENGDEKAKLAMKMFINRIIDYIAKYYFELEGCDAIILTAGVGENGALERKLIADKLKFLGVELDEEMNNKIAGYKDLSEGCITTKNSTIPIYVVPTNEELMIAKDAYNFSEK